MPERYPGYDVLRKRDTPSWNEITRRVVGERLRITAGGRFLSAAEFATVAAIAARILPQPPGRPPVPVAALLDEKLALDQADGYRHASMPRLREAWRRGLEALDAAAQDAHGGRFCALGPDLQDGLLRRMEQGELEGPAWGDMPCKVFFKDRLLRDLVLSYYAHPTAWSEIGFGGPASPRGYVRMGFNRRDPWEPAEARDGSDAAEIRRVNARVR